MPRKPVLSDHVHVKRKLLSPFLAAMEGKLAPYSWTKQLVPEAIWLALLIDRFGYETAAKDSVNLALAASRVVAGRSAPPFVRLSAFNTLSIEEKISLNGFIDAALAERLALALSPLTALAPDHPLAFIRCSKEIEEEEGFSRVLHEIYDKNSRISVLTMALAYYIEIRQGKLHIAPHLVENTSKNFEVIVDYPNSEASLDAAGSFRASAPMLFRIVEDGGRYSDSDDDWVVRFWRSISGFGPCVHLDAFVEVETYDQADQIGMFVAGFRNAVRKDLRARLTEWTLDLNETEEYEVIGALLARQATLAIDLVAAPSLWTPHSAPILLRAMADVFITMAWILKKPKERSIAFIEDGLGAVKLMIAHKQRAIEETSDSDDIKKMQQMIDMWQSWLDGQRVNVFIEVNLGSWSGMNTRRMAEEAGFIDFYNNVYQPFSGAAHSNWFHLSAFNTRPCQNPAHRGHLVPTIALFDADVNWLFLAAKYLQKTFLHFDETHNLAGQKTESFDYLNEQLSSEQKSAEACSAEEAQ